ncbi:MAG: heparinase II/III family protein [Opitutaceae bacterium]
MHPSLLFSPEAAARRPRIEEIKRVIASPVGSLVWSAIREAALRERDLPPYLVTSVFPGRDRYHAELLSMDYALCRAIGLRIQRHALMFLIDHDRRWLDAALRQTDVLFDDVEFPAWNHVARMAADEATLKKGVDLKKNDVHLRTGMLAKDVGLMLNWLRPHLIAAELETLVRGLDKRAIRPFQKAIAQQPWWLDVNNNWLTCIVGGLGIAGMALDGLHPDARSLIDFADPLMERHLEDFGPEGEFNEGLGYAGAITLVVEYFAARLGWTAGQANRLAAAPFPAIARWYVQMTVPPGHLLSFGDGHIQAPLRADWTAALAAASQDAVLQDFYLSHRSVFADPQQLLCLDSDLSPRPPVGIWPLGRAFSAHGACITSRTSWNWQSTACVVGSKARREDNHEHNDAGQVVIEGEGQPLIVDWGSPDTSYPAGFFTENRFRYFEANAFGHNVLVFGHREMKSCYELHPKYTAGTLHGKRALHAQGRIVSAKFDDTWGGQWTLDTAPAWDGVEQNLRTVLHVHPGFVIVLDEAVLDQRESISIRWNTAQKAVLTGPDSFVLQRDNVGLAARILNLNGSDTTHHLGHHRYLPPWNKDEFGGILPGRDCPYYEAVVNANHCRFLTLFSVQPGRHAQLWTQTDNVHIGAIGEDRLTVVVKDTTVTVRSSRHDRTWHLGIAPAS